MDELEARAAAVLAALEVLRGRLGPDVGTATPRAGTVLAEDTVGTADATGGDVEALAEVTTQAHAVTHADVAPHAEVATHSDVVARAAAWAAHLDAIAGHVERALGRMRFHPVDRGAPLHPSDFGPTPRTPPPSFPSFAAARALDGPHAEAVRALLDALAALQERLVFEADCQESVDALNTSREFLFAAGHLDLAEPHALALAHLAARQP